jgi:hypothetical protein
MDTSPCSQIRFESCAPAVAEPGRAQPAGALPKPEPAERATGKPSPCEVCGNQYDKSFQVVVDGIAHTFDSFECAVHRLAPVCAHCGCRILGHGVEASGTFYCCSNCAREAGVHGTQDRTRG